MPRVARRTVLLSACLSVALGVSLAAVPEKTVHVGDWPQWRGPGRDGISTETGLLDKWPTDGPPLAWTGKDLGTGYASISIENGKIYTMGDRDDSDYVIALSADDGHELWSTKIGKNWDQSNSVGPHCTPAADGKFVYALSPHGDLVCLETAHGKIHWQLNMEKDFGGRMMSGWGYSESPLVDGDRLICTPGGKDATIVALNKFTGKTIWKSAVPKFGKRGSDGAAYSSVIVGNGAGVRQYVQMLGRGLVGIATKDGKFLWGYDKVANGTANIDTPIVDGDYVFESTSYGAGSGLVKLSRDGKDINADEVYFIAPNQFNNHHGGVVLVDGYLYGGHGQNNDAPVCVEFKTGKIMWKKDRGTGRGSAAVLYADGKLYFRYDDGLMVLIQATPEEYKEISTFKIPDVLEAKLAAPGDRRRQALSTRARQAVVLQAQVGASNTSSCATSSNRRLGPRSDRQDSHANHEYDENSSYGLLA